MNLLKKKTEGHASETHVVNHSAFSENGIFAPAVCGTIWFLIEVTLSKPFKKDCLSWSSYYGLMFIT